MMNSNPKSSPVRSKSQLDPGEPDFTMLVSTEAVIGWCLRWLARSVNIGIVPREWIRLPRMCRVVIRNLARPLAALF